jgi:PTS system ascorbate-specific IIC component
LGFLKNSNVTIVLTMLLLFVIVYTGAYIAHPREVSDYMDANGSVNSLGVALVLDAFIFTAGLLVLIYGVTMMVNELKECITGISRRFIPGAVLSVDASVILKTQPTAVMLGFIFSFLGCLITTIISYFLIKSNNIFSSVVLPSVIVFFFIGGTCGIFGNYYGGIYGCIISSFLIGLIVSFVPILFQTVFNTFSHPAYSNYW